MPSAAWPTVRAAVITVAEQALPSVRVIPCRDISENPDDVVMIGVQDISDVEDNDWASAGSFQQQMQSFGGNRQETGTVNGLILASNGQGDLDAAEAAVFEYLAAIEAAVRADPTLGLTQFDYVVAETQGGDVRESLSDRGAAAGLAFVINYAIRI